MAYSYIGTESFRDSFNGWCGTSSQKYVYELARNKSNIPESLRNYTRYLYRVERVSDIFIDRARNGRSFLESPTVWYKTIKEAKMYSEHKSVTPIKYNDILITKVIKYSDQVIDTNEFISFMGIPQLILLGYDRYALNTAILKTAVIVVGNLKITNTDYEILSVG